jgi:hypothetical protein
MATVHKSKEDAIQDIGKFFDSVNGKERLLENLRTEFYTNSDVEFILEAFDGNTNHVIIEEKNG